jgi:glycosyltransferase involved in cell wall biosynthesis
VLHNGISASEWHVPLIPPTEVSFECGDLSGKKIILYAGRLSGGKGANEILTALQKVLNSVPNAYLLVLGKRDGYAEKMMERIEKLGIGRSVGFTGWVSGDKLKHAYRISDVVVVPSVYLDPFPTVNLEAMASGKPVVGSCFGGTPEVVEDGKTGYVVNPLDIETFSDKITALLLNERMAKEMGDNGRECVEKSFSLDTQVEKLLALYNKNLEI